MLNKNLQKLSDYIEQIESLTPLDFFKKNISELQKLDEPVDAFTDKQIGQFVKDMGEIIQKSKADLSEDIIIIQMYHYLLFLLKKRAIFAYASDLGINPSLYKKEMRFLFKGIK